METLRPLLRKFDADAGSQVADGEIRDLQRTVHVNVEHRVSGKSAPFMLPCSNAIIASVEAFIREKDPEHELLAELNEEYFKVDKFQIHVKNGACGLYVVTNQDVMTDLLGHDRNLRALDMDGYGLYTASYVLGGDRTALMIKAVADLGDKDKGDIYHDQCSFTSALFLREFLKYRFSIQEKPVC